MKQTSGFTLSELLIALAILALIAVFTIPKVLQSQQESKYNTMAKESAGMISVAYSKLRLETGISATTRALDLTPFMNYVKIDTVSQIDFNNTATVRDCSDGSPQTCMRLHNGAILRIWNANNFGAAASTAAIGFIFDPNGQYDGAADSPGKSVQLWLYYDGKVRTQGTLAPSTYSEGVLQSICAACDPPWFHWD